MLIVFTTVPKIEEAERICQRNARYDSSYKAKNWRGFFAVSKEIIDEEEHTVDGTGCLEGLNTHRV